MQSIRLLLLGLVLPCLPLAAHAQATAFPTKPVTIIVPFGAGGVADGVPRIVGQELSRKWGVPVIIENKPGASGNIGMAQVARSAPDGYTYALAPTGNLTSNPLLYRNLTFDTSKDLTPVALLALSPNVLVVSEKTPVNNLQELIDYAKAHPDALNYASPGAGSGAHLAGEQFKQVAGISMTHIPYNGMAQAVNDVLAGNVDVMFAGISTVTQHIKAGKLKALAIAGPSRSDQLPDVPTAHEAGMADFDVTSWYGLVAPSQVPGDILDKVNADILSVLKQEDVQRKFHGQGVYPADLTRRDFADYVKTEATKWGDIIQKAHIEPLN